MRLAFSLGILLGTVTSNSVETAISEIIEPAIGQLGFGLVRVQLQGSQRARLQVMAERIDLGPMTLDDCASLSTVISAVLDAHDPIAGSYTLEVSSPGIDRPLVQSRDFDRFRGHLARIETSRLINGRRRFSGRLLGREGTEIRLEVAGEIVMLALEDVAKAKLILTEDLLTAHAAAASEES